MLRHKDGICPLCGERIEYASAYKYDDDGATLDWECSSCGATGKAGFNLVFDQHYGIVDRGVREVEKGEFILPPMTNADRIRDISDKELAEFLDKVDKSPCGTCCDNMDSCLRNNAPEPVCKRHFLEWLQQPAEEWTK